MNRKFITSMLLIATVMCGMTGALATDELTVPAEDNVPVIAEASEGSSETIVSEETEIEAEATEQEILYELQEVDLELLNPVTTDETGTFYVPEDGELIDFIFPEEIGGTPVYVISEDAFKGFEAFRTVVIPSSIEEIGEDAFADCENLERIILEDRADTSDLILGENWCGDAEVEFGLIAIAVENETSEPAPEIVPEEGTEPAEPAEPQEEEMIPSEEETLPEDEESLVEEPSEEAEDAVIETPSNEPEEEEDIPEAEVDESTEPLSEDPPEAPSEESVESEEAPSEPEPEDELSDAAEESEIETADLEEAMEEELPVTE